MQLQRKIDTLNLKQSKIKQQIQQLKGGYGGNDTTAMIKSLCDELLDLQGRCQEFLIQLWQKVPIKGDDYNVQVSRPPYLALHGSGYHRGDNIVPPLKAYLMWGGYVITGCAEDMMSIIKNNPTWMSKNYMDSEKWLDTIFSFYVKWATIDEKEGEHALGPGYWSHLGEVIKYFPPNQQDRMLGKYKEMTKMFNYYQWWNV